MTRKVVETIICNRCKGECAPVTPGPTIGDLAWMVLVNGGGSRDSRMAYDLCAACTTEFLDWWNSV